MITVQDIKKYSKPHPNQMEGARQTVIFNEAVDVSIVGGARGLYGDFEETFELAVIDKSTKEFVTKFFCPENNDDVIGYMEANELELLVNQIFVKGFQVR